MVDHKVDPYENDDMRRASAPSVDDIESISGQSRAPPPSYKTGAESQEQPTSASAMNSWIRPSPNTTSDKHVPDEEEDLQSDDVEAPLLGNTGDALVDPFRDLPPPPQYAPYRATYKQKGKGVVSRDDHINEDGEALYRFLLDHNSPPAMEIKVHGSHDVTKWRTETHHNSDGTTREEQHPYTEEVVDFDFKIDVSQYVSPLCSNMYVQPDTETGQSKSIRELCDSYVRDDGFFKELQMQKYIEWNYKELTQAILYAMRCQGYHYNVSITFPLHNYRVTVKSKSKWSQVADSKWVKALLIITCLWIFAVPAYMLLRKRYGHKDLKSEWKMTISEEEWYRRHVHEILGQVKYRQV
ncbi:hypothetical protein INT44_006464 [Umbelopsis vinacea]|uniref:Uncharacterized protein n=1 Tax=Umbelopsis vinacea TaxID=44442 RepID=A0A8H7UBN3_9FUNG|nr:hypothetical protein INT44_006464 [Umbelopsis vinacea]